MARKIVFTVKSAEQGKQLYGQGLKHKILTLPEQPGVTTGDAVEVALSLAFCEKLFTISGSIAHSGAMATIVQLDAIPAEVFEALGVAGPTPAGGASSDIERTQEVRHTVVSEPPPPAPAVEDPTPTITDPDADRASSAFDEPSDTFDEPSAYDDEDPDSIFDEPPSEDSSLFDDSPSEELDSSFGAPPPEPAPPAAAEPDPPPAPAGRPAMSGGRPSTSGGRPSMSGGRASVGGDAKGTGKEKKGGYRSARRREPAQPAQPPPPGEGVPVPGRPNEYFAGTAALHGSLAKVSMREVFMELLKESRTGLLVVDGFRERYWGYFVGGRPLRYIREPASRSESIEYQASRQQLLKPAEVERIRYAAGLCGVQLDDALVKMGVLNRQQVDDLNQESARMITERLLGVNFGHFRFFELPEITKLFSGTPVEITMVLWRRSRERYTGLNQKQVREIVDRYYKFHLVLTEAGRDLAEPLIDTLAGQEQRFLRRYLRGGWQLSELLGRLEMPTAQLIQLVLSMQDLGVIELNEREGERWREARAERYIIDRMDYMERDHFAFIEAHWSCLEPELMRACDKVARNIEDPMMDHLELDKLAEMRQQIRTKLAEVRALFSDETRRKTYRNDIVEQGKRQMAGELFHKQGEMELFKPDIPKAKECFERVLELDPGGSGAQERLARSRKVLKDLAAGIVTKADASMSRPDEDMKGFEDILPEDLDEL